MTGRPPGTGREAASSPIDGPGAEDFLRRYGDLIDDHLAEIVDEVIEEALDRHVTTRTPWSPLTVLVVMCGVPVVLLAALITSAVLHAGAIPVVIAWICAAVCCHALARLGRRG